MAAAYAANCRRALISGTCLLAPCRVGSRLYPDLVKSNGNRLFLVDTLALVRRLEGQVVPSKQAEGVTGALIEVLNDCLENVSHSCVSKTAMPKNEMTQESILSKFKTQVKSSQVIFGSWKWLIVPAEWSCP